MKITNIRAVRLNRPAHPPVSAGRRPSWWTTDEVANPMSRYPKVKRHRSLWLPRWEQVWCRVTLEDGTWGVGSTGYGFIASAVGYGSIVGALLAANFSTMQKRGRILVWTTFIYMSLVTLFAASTVFALSFALLVVAGIANSVYLMFIQVMLQLTVTDEYRGRVMSLYVMLNGITPFSALLMGTLIEQFGPQITVACFTGLAAGIVLVIGIFSRRLREI